MGENTPAHGNGVAEELAVQPGPSTEPRGQSFKHEALIPAPNLCCVSLKVGPKNTTCLTVDKLSR